AARRAWGSTGWLTVTARARLSLYCRAWQSTALKGSGWPTVAAGSGGAAPGTPPRPAHQPRPTAMASATAASPTAPPLSLMACPCTASYGRLAPDRRAGWSPGPPQILARGDAVPAAG